MLTSLKLMEHAAVARVRGQQSALTTGEEMAATSITECAFQ